MPITSDESGRRSVQVEVEVPGTPEQVWRAIATGPGISSWFFPTELEERTGGAIACHFGPGMDAVATVTDWDPPRRFAAAGHDLGPGAPPLNTEWVVEPRPGALCVVRVVHSLLTDSADWDDHLESSESGWPGFFGILRLYLMHFPGQSCATMRLMANAAGPESNVWETLTAALGIAAHTEGEPWTTPVSGAPPLAGVIEKITSHQHPDALLRLDHPAPGIASASAFTMGDQVHVGVSFYFYGGHASADVARYEPQWQTWIQDLFPPG